ncbi:MAG: endolytic transglycosylase MltG [Muribaculaceae bacterium]|nr:endolytic transglycosylase MltG [Muribaculaceae bacterium]
MKKRTIVFAALMAAAAGTVGWGLWTATAAYGGAATRVNIPAGATESAIADSLSARLGSAYASKVMRIWSLAGGQPRTAHGSYLVEPGTKAMDLARRVRNGRQTPVRFTFNNIRTLRQLAERAGEAMEFSADDFLAACDSVLSGRGYRSAAEYPAAFIPDSYEFYWTAPAVQFVGKLADARDRFWNDERRAAAARLGLRPVEVATIASIAEEETADRDERPTVARLYMNRLQRGVKLQADPTVKFAVGDFSLRRITGRHLAVSSAYNTYQHEGLPPGPIRIADAATLRAVLSAPAHDYLYMCAKEDFSGRHNFAVDGATHMANARRYRAALDRRGIK